MDQPGPVDGANQLALDVTEFVEAGVDVCFHFDV